MKDYITSLSMLAISVGIYASSASFVVEGGGLAKNPAYYPRALALLVAVLSIALLITALVRKQKPGISVNKELLWNVGKVFGLILVYVIAFEYIGFIVSTLAFLVCGFLLYGGKLMGALLCGVPVTAGVYFLFHIIMQVPMPKGILL